MEIKIQFNSGKLSKLVSEYGAYVFSTSWNA